MSAPDDKFTPTPQAISETGELAELQEQVDKILMQMAEHIALFGAHRPVTARAAHRVSEARGQAMSAPDDPPKGPHAAELAEIEKVLKEMELFTLCEDLGCMLTCMKCGGCVPDLGPLKTPYVCDKCKHKPADNPRGGFKFL